MLVRFSGVVGLAVLCLRSFVSAETTREQFVSLAASHGGVIKLNSKTFDAITASNRDWSVAVQLTALGPQMKCEPCSIFKPNYDAVAQAWRKVPKEKRDYHFFATLDFSEGQEVFRR
ncbi:oligosaccharyl transferase subunit ost3/OST6, partial [Tulasnella sp. 403]